MTLDQWDLSTGQRLARFMETLKEHDKVLMICSEDYVLKSNEANKGGVAKERMYIEAILDKDLDSTDVIAILRDNPSRILPDYYGDRLRINFDNDKDFESRYWELASALLEQKLVAKPKLGRNPFLTGLDVNFGRADGIALINELGLNAHAINICDDNILILGNKMGNEPFCMMLDEIGSVNKLFNEGHPKVVNTYDNKTNCLAHNIYKSEDGYIINYCHSSGYPDWYLASTIIDKDGNTLSAIENKDYHAILEEDRITYLPTKESTLMLLIKNSSQKLDESQIIKLPNPGGHFHCTIHNSGVFLFGREGISRFNIDGSLDITFNFNKPKACFMNVNGIAFQDDEKLLLVGGGNEANLMRFHPDGSVDTDFGENGVVEFRATYRSTADRVFIYDNKILMGGTSNSGSGLSELFVARFDMNGKPDYTFNGEDSYISIETKGINDFKDMIVSNNKAYILIQSDRDAMKFSKIAVAKIHL